MANRHRRYRKPAGAGPAIVFALAGAAVFGCLPTVAAAQATVRVSGADVAPAALVRPVTRLWSDPSTLGACGIVDGPAVAFPSESPSTPTGPGAIAWESRGLGCGGPSASLARAPWRVNVAAIGPTERAALASRQSLAESSGAGLAAVGGSFGRVILVAPLRSSTPTGGIAAALEGRATRRLAAPRPLAGQGPPPALARAYLGDATIATVVAGPAIAVRVQRYFRHRFAHARLIPIPAGRVTALTATMDYRSDVLVSWQQNGAIYAHMLRASGRPDPTQRVIASAPYPQLRALVSDDDRGILAWSSTEAVAGAPPRTRIYIDLSAVGVRFGAPQLLASFRDPQRVCRGSHCLALVRLSTENVMIAWTDAEHGHYVVRAAPAVFAATRPPTRLSDARAQSVLADLAAGPHGDVVALWQSAPLLGGGFDGRRAELWAASAHLVPQDRLAAQPPEMVATAGPNVAPSLAVDPANDRAVAAWLTLGAQPRVEYAASFGAGGGHLPATAGAVVTPKARTHRLTITLAAGIAAAAAALLGWVLWRRRGTRKA